MKFNRLYTADCPTDAYAGIDFVPRASEITKTDGTVVFRATLKAPAGWGQLAVDMMAQKYCRKAGVPAATTPVDEPGVPAWLRRRRPDPGTTGGGETDARQLFDRLAGCWTYWGWKLGYFTTEDDARAFYDEHRRMMALQVGAENSPAWFNCGLAWAYGIIDEDTGLWAIDPGNPDTVTRVGDTYTRPGIGACFISSVEDSLLGDGGIMDFMTREARIFRQGSGSGANYSHLRGKDEPLSAGGKSSGLMSFLKPLDTSSGAIKSGGTTRRSARLIALDLDHPDVEEFVDWKMHEEKKVAALVAGAKATRKVVDVAYAAGKSGDPREWVRALKTADRLGVPRDVARSARLAGKEGVDKPTVPVMTTAYEGEAYQTVSGQNANNSVRVTHKFMDAVREDGTWDLYHRTERRRAAAEGRPARPCKTIKAKDLWDRIAYAAWSCADPGVQFHDTINEWHTCPEDGEIRTTNPCSEYNFLDDNTCNLACLNLCAFPADDPDCPFDVDRFKHAIRLYATTLDIVVSLAGYPSKAIAEGAMKYRTTGLGYSNLGALLMRNGVAYDSDAGRGWAAAVTGLMHYTAYATSIELAAELGAFPRFEANKRHCERVLRNHAEYLIGQKYEGLTVTPPDPSGYLDAAPGGLVDEAEAAARIMLTAYEKTPVLRNAQTTLVMPAGCLVGGSMVTTDRGLVRIGSLGDRTGSKWQDLTATVQTDQGPRPATKFYVNGIDDVIDVKTDSGYRIRGTPKHRIRVIDRTGAWTWRRFSELTAGDRVPLRIGGMIGSPVDVTLPPIGVERNSSVGRGVTVPGYVSERLGCLLGVFMGNGSLHDKGIRFHLPVTDPDLIAWVRAAVVDFFGIAPTTEDGPGQVALCANSTQLVAWWRQCGFDKLPPPEGSVSHVPRVPALVLNTNDPLVYCAFLRGVFSTDGTVGVGLPIVSSAKESFVDELRSVLLAVGVVTTTYTTIGEKSGRPVWNLRAKTKRYAVRFSEMIGFIPERKQRLLATAYRTDRNDRVFVAADREEAYAPIGTPQRADLTRWRRNGGGIPRHVVDENPELARPDAAGRVPTDYYFDTVVSAELTGREETFDVSVPDNVTYVADGFVSHNTVGLLMGCDTLSAEPDFSLVKYKTLAGGGNLTIVNESVAPALRFLGYPDDQVAAVEAHVLKTGRTEDAPHLKPEHLAVFDCANPAEGGTRSVSVAGHLLMMATIQPLLSGSISKTINLPNDCSVSDVRRAYTDAWQLGIKCVALYRDASKLSQPLSSAAGDEEPVGAYDAEADANGPPKRRRLPGRRRGHCQKFKVAGHKVYLNVGEYPDGTLGEIFLSSHKEGATFRSVMSLFAQAVSIALQYGVPLEEFVNAFTFTRFEPSGPVADHDRLKNCTSVVDAVFRHLGIEYLGRDDLAHTPPPENGTAGPGVDARTPPAIPDRPAEVRYEGVACPVCGVMKLRRDGKCYRCDGCLNAVGGCS